MMATPRNLDVLRKMALAPPQWPLPPKPGDLLVVFADALVRTWKQIIRFKPEGEMQTSTARAEVPTLETTLDEQLVAAMEGVVRDERGLRFEREESD